MICKPSEKTPLATAEVIRLLNEELPEGVLQFAAGAGELGAALAAHPVLTPDMGHVQRAVRELSVGTVKVNAAFGGAPGGAATPPGAWGDGFGYGPELLDELTRVRVVHVEPAPSPDAADLRRR